MTEYEAKQDEGPALPPSMSMWQRSANCQVLRLYYA